MIIPEYSIKRLLCVALCAASLVAQSSPDDMPTYGMRPFPGFVPDANTALGIAQPVMKKLVGSKQFSHLTLKATLDGKTWVIVGKTLPPTSPSGQTGDPGFSRVPILKIDKFSGVMSFEMQ
jgi:hypothetical protein